MSEQRLTGTIKYWNARKGFGFIEPPGESDKQIFVHIKAFTERKNKPRIGDIVSYLLSEDDTGRPRADEVLEMSEADLQQATAPTTRKNPVVLIATIAIVLAIVVIVIAQLA